MRSLSITISRKTLRLCAIWSIYTLSLVLIIISGLLPKSAKPEALALDIIADILLIIFLTLLFKKIINDHKRFKARMKALDYSSQARLRNIQLANKAFQQQAQMTSGQPTVPAMDEVTAMRQLNKASKERMKNNGNK